MFSISLQHSNPGDGDRSLAEVHLGNKMPFVAFGSRRFVADELGAFIKQVALSGFPDQPIRMKENPLR